MTNKIRHIIASILLVSLLAAVGGINFFHHFCNNCDEEFYSVFVNQECSHENGQNSCCTPKPEISCCTSEHKVNSDCNSISEKCCENELKQLKIEESFISSNKFSIPLVVVPVSLTFSNTTEHSYEIDEYSKYLKSRLDIVRSPHKVIIDYIKTLLSSPNTDNSSDFPSGI